MRQLSPPTNLLLACLASLGLLATLSLPWYAPPVTREDKGEGSLERSASTISDVFRSHDGAVTGSEVAGDARVLLFVLAAAVFALCAVSAVPALRSFGRDVLRAVAIATPVLVAVLAFSRPGEVGDGMNVHWGLFVALAAGLVIASTAWWGSEIRLRKPAPGAWARQT